MNDEINIQLTRVESSSLELALVQIQNYILMDKKNYNSKKERTKQIEKYLDLYEKVRTQRYNQWVIQ